MCLKSRSMAFSWGESPQLPMEPQLNDRWALKGVKADKQLRQHIPYNTAHQKNTNVIPVTHTHTHIYMNTYAHIHMNTYAHIHMNTYAHIHHVRSSRSAANPLPFFYISAATQ